MHRALSSTKYQLFPAAALETDDVFVGCDASEPKALAVGDGEASDGVLVAGELD